MRTNKEKYDYYLCQAEQLECEYENSLFPDGTPVYVYELNGTKITRGKVRKVKSVSFYENKKPSRADVQKIRDFCKNPVFDINSVYIGCEEIGKGYHKTWSYKYLDIIEKPNLSFSPWDLRQGLRKNRKKYTLKSGDVACSYCMKAIQEVDAIRRKIISIATYGDKGKMGVYCSTDCAMYDQFAHEG